MSLRLNLVAVTIAATMGLAGCSGAKPSPTDPGYIGQEGPTSSGSMPGGSILGDSSLVFGNAKNKPGDSGTGGGALGVNAYLWRGALDTLSFMPLASADPFGGVIITDWYSPPDTPDERFKVNVFILGRDLRADGVRASVFHQKKDVAGQWNEAAVDANTATDLENAILTRARQIRLSAVANQQ